MNFRVGQKVVCVNDCFKEAMLLKAYGISLPVRNDIYTVREVLPNWIGHGNTHITLHEIHNSPTPWLDAVGLHEAAYGASRFRPLVERKTDISIFTKMLTDVPVKITERA